MTQGLGGSGAFAKLGVAGNSAGSTAARAVLANVVSQGVAVTVGRQSRFDFVGVAAAGVGAAAGGALAGSRQFGLRDSFGGRLAVNTASGIANAASRSVIEGTDFGDNIMAALPNVLGSTIGNAIAGRIGGRSGGGMSGSSGSAEPQPGAGGGQVGSDAQEGDIVITARGRGSDIIDADVAAYAVRVAQEEREDQEERKQASASAAAFPVTVVPAHWIARHLMRDIISIPMQKLQRSHAAMFGITPVRTRLMSTTTPILMSLTDALQRISQSKVVILPRSTPPRLPGRPSAA